MSLEALIGLDPQLRSNRNDQSQLPILEALEHDELKEDGKIKMSIPMMYRNENVKLPRVVDEYTRKELNINFYKGTTTLSFIYKNGIVVCADSRATGGQFIFTQSVQKIIPINKFLLGTMAGGAADCSYWERVLSEQCRLYELRNREPISVAAASKILVNMLYNYRGMGLSLGTMICGWDHKRGPRIYMVDNDGRRLPGQMFSVGSGSVYAYGILDKGYRFDMTDEEAYDLGQRAIFHATHRDSYSGGVVRVYTVKSDGWKIISEVESSALYDRYNAENSASLEH